MFADLEVHDCRTCEAGSYSVGGNNTCTACELGSTHQPLTGKSSCDSCKLCGVGKYIEDACTFTEGTVCADCKAGKASTGDETSCAVCLEGKYAAAGAGFCATVEAGHQVVNDDGELRIGVCARHTLIFFKF